MKRRERKFVVKKAVNGQPYFTLVASNGQVIMVSETYSSRQAMLDTLDTLLGKTLPTRVDFETG
jgi:uncharacterized protein YegP (UPF0339 family)